MWQCNLKSLAFLNVNTDLLFLLTLNTKLDTFIIIHKISVPPGFCDHIFKILQKILLNSAAIFLNPNIQNLHKFLHVQEIL